MPLTSVCRPGWRWAFDPPSSVSAAGLHTCATGLWFWIVNSKKCFDLGSDDEFKGVLFPTIQNSQSQSPHLCRGSRPLLLIDSCGVHFEGPFWHQAVLGLYSSSPCSVKSSKWKLKDSDVFILSFYFTVLRIWSSCMLGKCLPLSYTSSPFNFFYLISFEVGSCSVIWVALDPLTFLPQPPEYLGPQTHFILNSTDVFL